MPGTLPVHVGFVVDGNRRWAKERGISISKGHEAGYEALKEVMLEVLDSGVRYASAFIFSTENWSRSPSEVERLMRLFVRVLTDDTPQFLKHNVRVRVVGSRERLSKKLVKVIENVERVTGAMRGGELLLCLNYGGHLEITEACKKIVQSGVAADAITPQLIAQHLYAPDVPACDLIVRTSGEQRLSNFMLWRAAYSELLFLKKMWPEMTKDDVPVILEEYARRGRRFGG